MKLPFLTWEYEKQTRMKHLVFSDYFDKWIKILGKYKSLNFIDCFGGRGVYEEGNEIKPGSPILAAKIIQDNYIKLNRETTLVIIEKNKSNIENIKKVFDYYKLDVKKIFVNDEFDKTINELLDDVKNLRPTFFLVDPFGFKIKISTLRRIMQVDRSEIFLNFMYNGICRNLRVRSAEETLNDLFGDKSWKNLCSTDYEKEKRLVKLFKNKLKEFSKYVFYYRICFPNMVDRTYYYLFHLTNHPKGCSIMKSCFAKYNGGRLEYNECNNELMKKQRTLIDIQEEKINIIKKCLLDKYKDSKLNYLGIVQDLIDTTNYLESELTKGLKELELENKIKIVRVPDKTPTGKERKSILNTDVVMF